MTTLAPQRNIDTGTATRAPTRASFILSERGTNVPGDTAASQIRNAMTIDVEDYFQVSAFAPHISRESWPSRECRVEANIDRILQILSTGNVRATFFTLGWIAERYPAMVKKIVAGGHELASHGYGHLRASDQSREDFSDDITRSKALLEDIGGQSVIGYRAPSFSIGTHNLWALDTLFEAGYRYSSSIYPIRHDHYGMPDAPRFAFYPNGKDGLLEIPITTVQLMGKNLPAGGGGYFRLLPYALSRWMMRKVNDDDRQPAIFYFHPWELDPGQPRQQGIGMKTAFRHYVNLSRMEARVEAMTRDFKWDRMDRIFLGSTTADE
jgi:polysaccharide deacetylase family protein (PEP-CTERM system associated)